MNSAPATNPTANQKQSAEPEDRITVRFEFDGIRYEIDLSTVNAMEFRAVLHPYIQTARTLA